MAWDRNLWGVAFTSGKDRPMLIGGSWLNPRQQTQYNGEPTRALLFLTRAQAREWCQCKKAEYAFRYDCCAGWRFHPVRVRETVVIRSIT